MSDAKPDPSTFQTLDEIEQLLTSARGVAELIATHDIEGHVADAATGCSALVTRSLVLLGSIRRSQRTGGQA